MPGGVVADPARIRNQTEDLTAAGTPRVHPEVAVRGVCGEDAGYREV
jgi:hypothetical protein